MADMGNKKTSVCDRKGSARYPKCVMYQYQENAAAYNALLKMRAIKEFPSTIGNKKSWTPSVGDKNRIELVQCRNRRTFHAIQYYFILGLWSLPNT